MSEITKTDRTKVKRVPDRGVYDRKTINEILDSTFHCSVAFDYKGRPMLIPTLFGRDGDLVYFHGAMSSRMMKELNTGMDIAFSVTIIDGLVLARSAFHHSMNYRSVVAFGKATAVADEDKMHALKCISDHVIAERWDESRLPNAKELKATMVLKMTIDEASAKIRTGPPSDDKPDYDLDIWAGEIPLSVDSQKPIADPVLREGIPVPSSVSNFIKKS